MKLLNSAVFGVAAFGCLGFVFVGDAVAQPTLADSCQYSENPVPCDEDVASMGTYRIRIDTGLVDLFDGCDYYVDCHDERYYQYPRKSWAERVLTSPTLYDSNTVIGRSVPHLDGDPVFDTGVGTQVGDAPPVNLVADSDFDLVPPGFEGPAGTSEVHTEILSLNMTRGLAAVRAGQPSYPWLKRSVGEVESKTVGPPDFPAESFFDVYVEVDIPACGDFPGATVYNTSPMVVEADIDTNGFPPRVVYIHGVTNAVSVYFRTANPPLWEADDRLGLLVLAGHGAERGPGDIAEYCLAQDVEDLRAIPTVTEWGLAVMCVLLLAAGGVLIRRRRALEG